MKLNCRVETEKEASGGRQRGQETAVRQHHRVLEATAGQEATGERQKWEEEEEKQNCVEAFALRLQEPPNSRLEPRSTQPRAQGRAREFERRSATSLATLDQRR
ncbi:unnamed protein product [Lampetra fluviatilis]